MTFKLIILVLFIGIFFYSLVRPFSSLLSKVFVLIGSILGSASVIDISYVNTIAAMVGIQSGKDLYLYITLITVFLFVCYSWEKFKSIEKKIATIVKALAITEAKK